MTGAPAALAVLVHTETPFEANAIVVVLEDAGIEALVVARGEVLPGLSIERSGRGITVQVREPDLDAARRALDEAREDAPVDWSTVDIGEEVDRGAEQDAGDQSRPTEPKMPLVARAGRIVAFLVILVIIVLFVVMLFV